MLRRFVGKAIVLVSATLGVVLAVAASQLLHPYAAYRCLERRSDDFADLVAFAELGSWAAVLAYAFASGAIQLFRLDWMREEHRLWSENVSIGVQGYAGVMNLFSGAFAASQSELDTAAVLVASGLGLIAWGLWRNRRFKSS